MSNARTQNQVEMMEILLEYTDTFLLPRLEDMFSEQRKEFKDDIARSEYNLKVYIDDKLADQTTEIMKWSNKRFELKK